MRTISNYCGLILVIQLLISCNIVPAHAANVDTVSISSNVMHKNVKNVVIYPGTDKTKRYPVLYLLHGYGGSYNHWLRRVPIIKELAESNQMIIVCPDGAFSSWYVDSPVDSTMRYETYIYKELVDYVDAHYNTLQNGNKSRAITGYSMGGFGAMFLALRHPDVFGACGSMSGALNLTYIKKDFDVNKRLGDTVANAHFYKDWSIISIAEKNPAINMPIIMDCGTDDFIYGMSKEAHEKLVELKIPHDYIERPGKHDWTYWRNAIQYEALFFKNFFEMKK